MSARVGRIGLRFETSNDRREVAERAARELRSALPDALGSALAPYAAARDVAVVPRLHVTVRASLAGTSGRDLARTIAEACVRAIAEEAKQLAVSPFAEGTSAAEEFLNALTPDGGVRAEPATEAAAWLIALARDERPDFRRASSFADDEHLPTPAALIAACDRCGARAVIAALGLEWARTLARRCNAREALLLLQQLDDRTEPSPQSWAFAAQALRAMAATTAHVSEVRGLLVALEGLFAQQPGIVAALRSLLAARILEAAAVAVDPTMAAALTTEQARAIQAPSEAEPLASTCTGFWLLLPHLTPRIRAYDDDDERRAVAALVARRLWGDAALDDPAITAFLADFPAPELCAPTGIAVDRLAVGVVRDFARTLFRFERARRAYILRSLLFGSGTVRRTSDGWSATLPQSPLRIVIERTAPYGEVATPWTDPVFTLVRDP